MASPGSHWRTVSGIKTNIQLTLQGAPVGGEIGEISNLNKKLLVEKCKRTGHDCADFRADLSVLISRIDLSDGFPILSRLCRKTSLIIPLSRHRRLGHQQLLVDAQHLPNFFSDPQKFDLLYCDFYSGPRSNFVPKQCGHTWGSYGRG